VTQSDLSSPDAVDSCESLSSEEHMSTWDLTSKQHDNILGGQNYEH
jgi:hypothetical protein